MLQWELNLSLFKAIQRTCLVSLPGSDVITKVVTDTMPQSLESTNPGVSAQHTVEQNSPVVDNSLNSHQMLPTSLRKPVKVEVRVVLDVLSVYANRY